MLADQLSIQIVLMCGSGLYASRTDLWNTRHVYKWMKPLHLEHFGTYNCENRFGFINCHFESFEMQTSSRLYI